ncbi:helix-turn-helix domain-containing protein [Caballeronia sp. LjRoot34]|uniref:Crp/Fnr family transcriptional regulator n=1 Tax=Caballeronia sp. LjRoot34 TaxID=3342325 RepID=UPI003ECF08D1
MLAVQLNPATHPAPAASGQQSRSQSAAFPHYLPSRVDHAAPAVPVAKGATLLDLTRLQSILCTTRKVKRGSALYRTHDPFDSIYTVRTGCFKTVITHRDGKEQVTGFQFMGEVLGLDGLCTERHNCDAIALEDSEVSVIRFALLASLCHQVSSIQHHFYSVLSGEIVRESAHMMMLGTMSAEQRVAAFLLDLSDRMKARGYSPVDFNLRMTREEMGNYMGIKLETVSRMFSKLKKQGLVDTHGKQIRIVNRLGLSRV